jgi:ketosteroid isomerase-like protein
MTEEPTTPDPEESARLFANAFSRRDFDVVVAMLAPDAIWDTSPHGVGLFRGEEAIRRLFEDWLGAYDDYEQELEEFSDLGSGVSLAVLHQRGRLRGSSGLVERREALVTISADGLAERVTAYPDVHQARAAAERLAEERRLASSETPELVRAIYTDWASGDYTSAEWAHPEIEFVIVDGPTPGRWRGLDGMAEGWRGFLSAWEEFHGVGGNYRELEGDRVLLLHSFGGRGKGSGLDVSRTPIRAASILDVNEGKVTRFVIYFDRDRAFADLGLEE